VGDNNKVALFEQTVAAMEALAVRVKNALGDGGQDLERRGSTLRELTREVRAQEERFRSVMSWDVGRALTDDLADELDRLIAEGESLLQELRAAFPSGGAVRPGRRRVAPSEPDRLGSQMKAIRQELRADPWNEGVQGRLYAVLVEIHRLVRLHVKREAP
jgi:acyl-CoA reductase-like NAD-dependent aldehyde dehydrogenase